MFASRFRAARGLSRQLQLARPSSSRAFTSSAARQVDLAPVATTEKKSAVPPLVDGEEGEPLSTPAKQAPNRTGVWSRSQKPRDEAMMGPRFEQTDYTMQVR
jgi:NADH dehydrogenase (ubiquinone) Fe-S protein 6